MEVSKNPFFRNTIFVLGSNTPPSLNDIMAENTIIFMLISQFVALTTCSIVGLACKAIHRMIGHSIEEIKLQFVGPQDWEEMEWAEVFEQFFTNQKPIFRAI